jgi:FkbM family methyltransferase
MITDEFRLRARRLAAAALPEPGFRALRRRRVATMVDRYQPRVVTHRYASIDLQVLLNDPLAERWYDADWPELAELPELAALQRHGLAPGARVFDLGAHQCVLALVLARLVGDSGSVVAVEAGGHNVRVAERNRHLNGASNLTILHAAAGDGAMSTLRFVEDLNGRVEYRLKGRARGVVEVPAVSVDGLAATFGPPDAVLIDVEGFEHRVLAGATATLAAGAAFSSSRCTSVVGSSRRVARSDDYVPLDEAADVTGDRFFLMAIPRSRRR